MGNEIFFGKVDWKKIERERRNEERENELGKLGKEFTDLIYAKIKINDQLNQIDKLEQKIMGEMENDSE